MASGNPSTQDKVGRVRPPHVQIKYEVFLDGAIVMKELPFVIGVLGDYSGKPHPDEPRKPVKDRTFVDIDRDNFDDVLKRIGPRLAFRVDNKIQKDDTEMSVEVRFEKMKDFEPDELVQKIPELKKLIDKRKNLSDLLAKMDGNDKLEGLLTEIIRNDESQKELGDALGIGAGSADGEAKEDPNVQ
ncbi:MAG: type VI secretion system contractile sheath small subunit [Acidobacteria bacterium]|nr:type VI secretion system contractile sheath small subunit [Acidobacteriota bacterium]